MRLQKEYAAEIRLNRRYVRQQFSDAGLKRNVEGKCAVYSKRAGRFLGFSAARESQKDDFDVVAEAWACAAAFCASRAGESLQVIQ